jgi:hypothetical protein
MSDFNEMLQKSYETISDLQSKLEALDKIYIEISHLKEAALKGNDITGEIPNELKIISEKYLKQIGVVTENYISISNNVLQSNQVKFHDSNDRFEKLLNQLSKVDLKKLFDELKIKFLAVSAIAIQKELSKIDEQTKFLQIEINKLSEIDLEKEFNKLQDTLSKIFNAINSINGTLSSVTGNLNNILTSLGCIQTSISEGFSNTIKNINKLESNILDELIESEGNNKFRFETIGTQFTAINLDIKSQFEKINTTIDSIVNQNNLLSKEIKTNRIVLLIGSVISFFLLIYLGFIKS